MSAIEQALKRLRSIAYQARYGGLMEDYKLAKRALEEWEARAKPKQLEMGLDD